MFQSTSNIWIVSSFYINRDYIAKELCINRFDKVPLCKGKCYLEKKISDNEKQEQKIPSVKEKEIQLYFCPETPVFHCFIAPIEISKSIAVKQNDNIESTFLYSIFHPPKMA